MRIKPARQALSALCSVLTVLVAIAACDHRAEPAAEREALLAADRAFAQMSVERGAVEAFYAYLSEDAMQMPAGSLPITGREAIRASMSAGPAYSLEWTPVDGSVALSGDLGWTWGNYVARITGPDGQPAESHGKYLNVWGRDAAGGWKVLVDMGNENPAEDAAE